MKKKERMKASKKEKQKGKRKGKWKKLMIRKGSKMDKGGRGDGTRNDGGKRW
jgi:hypothetical protein